MKAPHDYHPRELHFSGTSLEGMKCPRYYYFRNWLGLVPNFAKNDLAFGSAWHAGVAFFYSNRTKMGLDEVCVKSCIKFVEEWERQNATRTWKKNLGTGIVGLTNYCKTYYNDPAEFDPELIETEVWMSYDDTMFGGVIDRLQVLSTIRIVHDTKTWSSFPNMFWLGWENSFQMKGYYILANTTLGNINHVVVDGCKQPALDMTKDIFERRPYSYTDRQLKDWFFEYEGKVERVKKAIELEQKGDDNLSDNMFKLFPCESTQCTAYGGCPYLPVCKHGLDAPEVQLNFSLEESK